VTQHFLVEDFLFCIGSDRIERAPANIGKADPRFPEM